jgi:hypothetical protein
MHYVDIVDGFLQKDGLYYIGYCGESEDKASDFMFMVDLVPMADSQEVMDGSTASLVGDDRRTFCGERIMSLDSFIAKEGIKDCGHMNIHGNK